MEAFGFVQHGEVAGVLEQVDFAGGEKLLEDFGLTGIDDQIFFAINAQHRHFDFAHTWAQIGLRRVAMLSKNGPTVSLEISVANIFPSRLPSFASR